MKITLLLFLFIVFGIEAQTTHDLNWQIGVGTNVDLTITVGDIVRWNWTDNFTHTITSKAGSTETFDSGNITGNGLTYSRTFTQIGSNPYDCIYHALSMAGTITVESALDINNFSIENFSISPNPVTTRINLKIPNSISIKSITIYNLLGKEVYLSEKKEINIDVSNLKNGVYFLKVTSEESSHTKRFIKL